MAAGNRKARRKVRYYTNARTSRVKCPSGKVPFPSQVEAAIALSRSQARAKKGNDRRRESRSYRCPCAINSI